MPKMTKIKVNGTSYDIADITATIGLATLDTSLASFKASKGSANGIASLDNLAQIPKAQIPMSAIIDAIYPIGSLYWSSSSTNPQDLFGGTWSQIKDKFVLAAGDIYQNGSTGGASTVTLDISQIPSHNHGGSTGNGGVQHNHGMDHRHYTGNGDAWSPGTGSTGGISANHTHSFSGTTSENGSHSHPLAFTGSRDVLEGWIGLAGAAPSGVYVYFSGATSEAGSHTHTYSGNTGTVSADHSHSWGAWSTNARFINNEGVSRSRTDDASAYLHTHSIPYQGGGEAHENMPPYVTKYCWERIA